LLLTRVLTAAVLLGAFLAAVLLLGRAGFAVLVGGVIALGAFEWGRLAGFGRLAGAGYATACVALYAWAFDTPAVPVLLGAAALFWLAAVPWWLRAGVGPGRGVLAAAGIVVLLPAGLAMASLSRTDLLCVLGLTWVADTAAYFSGRAWGRRKLAPAISPGKTWEGVAGAAVGCLAYAIIWALSDASFRGRVEGAFWIPFAAGTLLLCGLSVVGDLFESALKRQAGAKDSGKLLPGHGGVLDRIDSATATLPVAMLLLRATGST
jgi:phosphatidate cytidylyltransferase